jgi:hypothetical protein
MKHLIIFEHWHKDKFKPLKYKEGDYAIYDKYVNLPGILVKVLAARNSSPYPYFVECVKPPYRTYSLQIDDLIDLNEKEQEELDLLLNTQKYNL